MTIDRPDGSDELSAARVEHVTGVAPQAVFDHAKIEHANQRYTLIYYLPYEILIVLPVLISCYK